MDCAFLHYDLGVGWNSVHFVQLLQSTDPAIVLASYKFLPLMSTPLTEKYRPKTLDEVTGNREVLECLKSLDISDLPNMLFYGPPGTGKTTAIRALLKDLPKQNVMELNASDHRGIDTVREKIKEFASIRLDGPKVVILDEADSMSRDAQGALRRVIEDFRSTRFCFICNYYKKIIDPIVSRCTKFRFSPVNEVQRIREVCLKEGIGFDEEGIEAINRFSDGDMRKVMNDIQGLASSYGKISEKNVLEFFGMKSDQVFQDIFQALTRDDFEGCQSKLSKSDVDCNDLINKLSRILVRSSMEGKMEILRQLADIEYKLAIGCTDRVQINAVIAAFILNRD